MCNSSTCTTMKFSFYSLSGGNIVNPSKRFQITVLLLRSFYFIFPEREMRISGRVVADSGLALSLRNVLHKLINLSRTFSWTTIFLIFTLNINLGFTIYAFYKIRNTYSQKPSPRVVWSNVDS